MVPWLYEILYAFCVFSIVSEIYKVTHLYFFVQNIIIGVILANTVLVTETSINNYILIPLSKGELVYIIAVVWGILHYTFFVRKYIQVYRAVMLIALALGMATKSIGNLDGLYTFTIGLVGQYSKDPLLITNTVISILAFLYWIYWKTFNTKLKAVLNPPRQVFRYALSVYFGYAVGMGWITNVSSFIGMALTVLGVTPAVSGATGVGIYVVLLIGVGVLIDIVVGWNKILGLTSRATQTQQAT